MKLFFKSFVKCIKHEKKARCGAQVQARRFTSRNQDRRNCGLLFSMVQQLTCNGNGQPAAVHIQPCKGTLLFHYARNYFAIRSCQPSSSYRPNRARRIRSARRACTDKQMLSHYDPPGAQIRRPGNRSFVELYRQCLKLLAVASRSRGCIDCTQGNHATDRPIDDQRLH